MYVCVCVYGIELSNEYSFKKFDIPLGAVPKWNEVKY